MLRRVCGAALLVLVGMAMPAYGQTTLEWKFKEGEKFYVEEVNDLKQNVSIIGKDVKNNIKITTISSYYVKSVSGPEVTLEQKIESVDVKSSGDGLGGQMDKLFEKLQGANFQITLKEGKVSKIKGYSEFIKKLADGDEGAGKFAKELLSEDALKKSIEDLFGNLPTKAISPGDTWSQEATIPFGPLGSFKTSKDMTYKEKDKDGALITYKSKMSYIPPKDAAFGGLLKIVKGNIKSENAKGSLLFNPEKGRLVRATFSMVARGSMTVEIMGNQLEMDLSADQTTTTRVLTKNPKAD